MSAEIKSCCGANKAATAQPEELKEMVKERYAGMVSAPKGSRQLPSAEVLAAISAGYTDEQLAQVPEHAAEHSFGCVNPVALSGIKEGQTVLDIGSGAGVDVFLAGKKVGPKGRVIGLDITPEMIEAATKNAESIGATNVEFRLGDAENMPVESETIDWIISNCVINLAPDKEKVFREAYRVLRNGGQLIVSDIVTNDLPDIIRRSADAWGLCVAGALEEPAYLDAIRTVGFQDVKIVARLDYDEPAIRTLAEGLPDEIMDLAPTLVGKVATIKVSAVKA